MALNIKTLWNKTSITKEYKEWAKKHDAFEQIAIVKSWTDFEDYDVSDFCKDASEVVALYAYIHFVLDVEFLVNAQSMAEDKEYEDWSEKDVRNAQILMNMING